MSGPTMILITSKATAQGGRVDGNVAFEEGRLYIHMEHAKGLGGSGEGANPEQLFALGSASCFNSALPFIAAQQKVDAAKAKVSCEIGMGRNDAGGFALAATRRVHIPSVGQPTAQVLVKAGHQVCPYANATRGNVPVTLVVQ